MKKIEITMFHKLNITFHNHSFIYVAKNEDSIHHKRNVCFIIVL